MMLQGSIENDSESFFDVPTNPMLNLVPTAETAVVIADRITKKTPAMRGFFIYQAKLYFIDVTGTDLPP
jgi:hypothetical protein